MSERNPGRTHKLSGVDVDDLADVARAVYFANEIGHWRHLLAIYGDHLPKCESRFPDGNCDCGWDALWVDTSRYSSFASTRDGNSPPTGDDSASAPDYPYPQ